ncbi:MAG: ATP-binding protein [Desulfobulbaceae bacterium]|nr:ATP-binding protein [Desulfobulbaceae bacterium]
MLEPNKTREQIFKVDNAFVLLREGYLSSEKVKLFNNYFEEISIYLGLAISNNISELLKDTVGSSDKEFIGSCIIRLYTIYGFTFDHFDVATYKVLSFLEKAIDAKIYKSLKIDQNMQTFEKESKLVDLHKTVEDEIAKNIQSLNSLESLSLFQRKYIRSIRNNRATFVLSAFVDQSLISDTRFNELFGKTLAYTEKRKKNSISLDKFSDAIDFLKTYIFDSSKFKTEYNKKYILKFANKILSLLNDDIVKFDQCKSTILSIVKTDKKYPLHEKNREILVSLIVNNSGPGYAYDVELTVKSEFENVSIIKPILFLGNIQLVKFNLDIPAIIKEPESLAMITVDVRWKNFDKTSNQKTYNFELEAQRTDISWEIISKKEPYSLEAVETYEELVGREEILNKLTRQVLTGTIGSSYVFGQKRVGKTSIVKTLRNRINVENYIIVFLESGDYICPSPEDTVRRLGNRLCEKIKESNKKFSNISIPSFESGGLSSLVPFLDSLEILEPSIKVLIILDEFDELPMDLYKRGPLGDSFFLTLRSISQKSKFGIILVGGEKISYIMSCQGDALNKFRSMRVDYFDRENFWNDFIELVKRPVKNWFEYSDESINFLYIQTSGNPFYTKWICSNVFEVMTSMRDCHVSLSEVVSATNISLNEISSNSFQHFWEDGIFETKGDLTEEISIKRRRILLALASLLRSGVSPSKRLLLDHELLTHYGHDEISTELEQFVRRKILIEVNGKYECKIKFFQKWLVNNGFNEILTTFVDKDSIIRRKQDEEKSFIKSEEITELTKKWSYYKGQKITDDNVRAWLSQFGNNVNQRLMFKILQSVNYYSSGRVREKLKFAHDIVKRGLTIVKTEGKLKMDEFLISYLDCPGKSGGGVYAKLYADENKIYYKNVIEKNSIGDAIVCSGNAKALIFIDDFIGTGGTAEKYFKEINELYGSLLRESSIKVFLIAICGFSDKIDFLNDLLSDLKLDINIHICDPIDDSCKCFSDNSSIFVDFKEREEAKSIAYEYGTKLVSKNYLGYGDCQTAIVFETNCPNNNLPILWENSNSIPWTPIFSRK